VKTLAIIVLLGAIAALPGYVIAEDPAQRLLLTAKQRADLSLNQKEPFELVVEFTAQQKLPAQGNLTLKWKSKEQWWRTIQLGDFKQIDVRNGGWLYTTRNNSSTPVRVRELIQLLQFGEDTKGLVADKPQQMAEYGFPVDCVRVKKKDSKETPHQVCLNGSHEISSDTWWDLPDSPTREEFTDYFDFAGHRYPRTLQLVENGSRVVKANVKSLSAKAFDEALLTKPAGAIERRQLVKIVDRDDLRRNAVLRRTDAHAESDHRQRLVNRGQHDSGLLAANPMRHFHGRSLYVLETCLLHLGCSPRNRALERCGSTQTIANAVTEVLQSLQSLLIRQRNGDQFVGGLSIFFGDVTGLSGNEGARHQNQRKRSSHSSNLARVEGEAG